MTSLSPSRNIPYPLRVETPSGEVHRYIPGGVINVDNKQDVEWLLSTNDWVLVNPVVGIDVAIERDRTVTSLVENGIVTSIEGAEAIIEVGYTNGLTGTVEVTEDEDLETPDLDELNKDGLLEFADAMGIDVDRRLGEDKLRDAINAFLDELEV